MKDFFKSLNKLKIKVVENSLYPERLGRDVFTGDLLLLEIFFSCMQYVQSHMQLILLEGCDVKSK